MGCGKWETELSDWAVDELSPSKAREFEQHIGQCGECARSAQRLGEVRQTLMSGLTDLEMPSRLVFVEKPQSTFAGFWSALLRTAALSAAAATIFLAVATVGFRYGAGRLLPTSARMEAPLTKAEARAFIALAVAEQDSLQRKETQASAMNLAASLSAEQMRDLADIQQQLRFLEMAQNTVWKQTQQQNEVISLVAHNQLQPPAGQ